MLEGSIKTLRKYYPGELYVHQNEVDDEEEYRKVFESFLDRHQFKNVNLLTTSKKFNIEFLQNLGYRKPDIVDLENIGLYHEAAVYWLTENVDDDMLLLHSDLLYTEDPTPFFEIISSKEKIMTELLQRHSFPNDEYVTEFKEGVETRVVTPFLYLDKSVKYDLDFTRKLLEHVRYKPDSLKGLKHPSPLVQFIYDNFSMDSVLTLFLTNKVYPLKMLKITKELKRPYIHFHNGQSVLKFLVTNKGWKRADKPKHYISELEKTFKEKFLYFSQRELFTDFFRDNMGEFFEG